MKRTIAIIGILFLIGSSSMVMAADHMARDDDKKMGSAMEKMAGMPDDDHEAMAGSDMEKMPGMSDDDHEAMGEHGEGQMTGMTGDAFKHHAVVEGIGADFKIMSLASMNMKDPEGNTHHIMVEFKDDSTKQQLKDAIGNIKVIAPDKQTQTNQLKNYGGIYAANFAFNQHGKYGVICLVKIEGKKHRYRFWYTYR